MISKWAKTLKNGESTAEKYNNFCKELLASSPTSIEIPISMTPVFAFCNLFKPAPGIPPTGDFIYGTLDGVPIEVKHNLVNQVVLKHIINIED